MRKTASAVMATLVGAGTAAMIAIPASAAAPPGCSSVITPGSPHGFYFVQTEFDANSANVTGGSTQAYVGKAVAEVALRTNQNNYSITTDDGKDVYKPGFAYYLGIDQDGDSATMDAIDNLFYEPQSYGTGVWHSGSSTGGVYDFMGTLAQFKSANPDAKISEFDANYGPGLAADDTVSMKSMTFHDCRYIFAAENLPPNATFTLNSGGDQNYRTFGFNAGNSSDPEGQALTYSWKFGDGSPTGHGAVVKHTYPAQKGRSYFATLTVSDGVNSTSTTRKVLVH